MRATYQLNTEKLEYNYRVLVERDHENQVISYLDSWCVAEANWFCAAEANWLLSCYCLLSRYF